MSDPEPPSSASVTDKKQRHHNITTQSSSSSPTPPNIDPLMILQIRPAPPGDPFVCPLPAAAYEHHFDSAVTNPKRPRYGGGGGTSSSVSQWKQLLPSPTSSSAQKHLPPKPQVQTLPPATDTSSSPSSSTNPPLQVLHASSSETAACSSPTASQERTTKSRLELLSSHGEGQLIIRKGKHVSPVWKPYEMLMLAKGWHSLYKSSLSSSSGGSGRANNKSRAEKDREVAEFLNRHGVERDAKAAGTKWDNMLGDFRKVYQWERGSGRIEAGVSKSYFRLSPYERKNQHGLPTCFDEDVFEEMAQFMVPRIRTTTTTTTNFKPQQDDDNVHSKPPTLTTEPVAEARLRRIGKMKMVWEEYVSLWSEQGETGGRGRVNIGSPSSSSSFASFLNVDELVFFDDSMVPSPLEVFENGPLRGFSVDIFAPGQQVKVFGRRKAAAATAAAYSSWLLECQDPSEYYLGRLKISPDALPALSELSSYLQEPPPEELRFPLRRDVYKDLPHGKELLFTTSSEPLDCRTITYDILGQVLRTNNLGACSTPSSRDSYIALWDDCINCVVRQFCSLEMVLVRKPATDISWPNVTGFINGLCLWRGEESDQVREGETDPSESLARKSLWSYEDLPYIFGYYAVGCTVTLCALSRRSQDNQVLRTDLISFNLSSQADRLAALIPCWRIATLLPVLTDKCINYNNDTMESTSLLLFSDFERIDLGYGGDVIERTPKSQIRYFSNKRSWASVKEIYDFLDRRIPFSEYLAESCVSQLCHTFKPRGCKVKPRTVDQLIEALKTVSKSLVALHDLSFMHRDISWDKVMRRVNINEVEWFLTGFDAAAGAPQMSAFGGGGGGPHAPEMRRGLHGVKVDVWGIGWLIKTSGLEAMLPMQLRELQSRCLEHNQEMRPTGADCYHHLLQLSAAAAGGY
ncbi:hypothetical protein QQ045_010819 [Rhodiola kirilowii]